MAVAEDQAQTIHAYSSQIDDMFERQSCKICMEVSAGWIAVPCGHAVSTFYYIFAK